MLTPKPVVKVTKKVTPNRKATIVKRGPYKSGGNIKK